MVELAKGLSPEVVARLLAAEEAFEVSIILYNRALIS